MDNIKREPEIGEILIDYNNGRYYITGIDGDKILYREFYEEDNGDIVVCGSERYMYLDEFMESPDFDSYLVSDGVKVIREY